MALNEEQKAANKLRHKVRDRLYRHRWIELHRRLKQADAEAEMRTKEPMCAIDSVLQAADQEWRQHDGDIQKKIDELNQLRTEAKKEHDERRTSLEKEKSALWERRQQYYCEARDSALAEMPDMKLFGNSAAAWGATEIGKAMIEAELAVQSLSAKTE